MNPIDFIHWYTIERLLSKAFNLNKNEFSDQTIFIKKKGKKISTTIYIKKITQKSNNNENVKKTLN
jgi:hypothetical protein